MLADQRATLADCNPELAELWQGFLPRDGEGSVLSTLRLSFGRAVEMPPRTPGVPGG